MSNASVRLRTADLQRHRVATTLPQRPVDAPSVQDLQALRSQVASLRSLGAGQPRDVLDMLDRFEARLPDPVSVLSLSLRWREGSTVLVLEAAQAEALAEAVQRFEQDAGFRAVALQRQQRQRGDTGGRVQAELHLGHRR